MGPGGGAPKSLFFGLKNGICRISRFRARYRVGGVASQSHNNNRSGSQVGFIIGSQAICESAPFCQRL